MQNQRKRSEHQERSARRRGIWATFLGIAVVAGVSLMMLTPSALASSHPVVVMSAPYTGVHTSISNSWSATSCSNAKITTAPSFSAATGVARMADKAWAASCGPSSYASASAYSGTTSTIPVKIQHHTASVVVLMAFTARLGTHIQPGVCGPPKNSNYSYCYESMYVSAYADAYLYDRTSGGYWFSSTYWSGIYQDTYNETYCYAGNCSYYSSGTTGTMSVGAGVTWWINATHLNPHDHFEVVFSTAVSASAYVDSFGMSLSGASASGRLDAGSGGNGFDVASITII
ncbi:MAG: hypothetical protein L3K10_03505 [Thermoplasmata archaeon]|nr:hypothetical protein [Thermoplasmata archaeon]